MADQTIAILVAGSSQEVWIYDGGQLTRRQRGSPATTHPPPCQNAPAP
ncbi:MAG: hypothetical protein MK102_03115 [Fuerstiella sp.]|nr:hypothetical protein [Fuerstiella sp.]